MEEKYSWLLKKTPRSVDQLRLWAENPRLNPEETHVTLTHFVEDLTDEPSDKAEFYALINSIVEDGFVPADPVVVWKNEENNKFYVAEGNRRVMALKLLREPDKAPRSIRSFIRKSSEKINKEDFEKIPVNVAPNFEEAEWYINQRNSSSSLQRKWSRVQQQRWILTLYEKHDGDLEKILAITKLSKSDLEGFIRILKIKDFVKLDEVKTKLTDEEFEKANSYRFPITILERFFSFVYVKEQWGLEYDGTEVNIISCHDSFFNAFAELIKRIVNKTDDNINTRINKEDLEGILESLPEVSFESSEDTDEPITEEQTSSEEEIENETEEEDEHEPPPPPYEHLKGNPHRARIVLPIYTLHTDSYRLLGLFNELKQIPIYKYPSHISSSLRVFLDLAVLKYIETEGLETAICAFHHEGLRNIPLKKRLEYIKTNCLTGKPQTIVTRIIDPSQEYSLDVLNGYIHGEDLHYSSPRFLNSFWDFMFPLFEVLLDIRES